MTHVYDIFEIRLTGPATGNPYLEVQLSATFRQGNRRVPVTGFHDGGADYVLRFMKAAGFGRSKSSFPSAPRWKMSCRGSFWLKG